MDFDGRLSLVEAKVESANKRLDAHGEQIDQLRLHRERVDLTLTQINATTTRTAADVMAIRERLDKVEDAPDEADAEKWRSEQISTPRPESSVSRHQRSPLRVPDSCGLTYFIWNWSATRWA